MVMLAVEVKISVEATDHRDAQCIGTTNRRPAERPLGGNIKHIGSLSFPVADKPACRRPPKPQFAVQGDAYTGQRVFAEPAIMSCGPAGGLAGMINPDSVTERSQTTR
jgi:hypothetical protein